MSLQRPCQFFPRQSFDRSFRLPVVRWLASSVLCGLGAIVLGVPPTLAGDRLTTYIGPVQISMDLDDLEVFASEGEIRGGVKLLSRRLDENKLKQFRGMLQRQFRANSTTLSRLLYTPMAETVLKEVGTAIETDSGINGFHAMRSAILLTAADQPDGFTALDVLRRYPTRDVRIDFDRVLSVRNDLETLMDYTRSSIREIEAEAQREATAETHPVAIADLPDLRQPGASGVIKHEITFSIEALRSVALGFAPQYDMRVDIYVPDNLAAPAPIVVLTHGFGSSRDNYEYLSEHLASHGLIVAAPEHIGSNLEYRQGLLEGTLSVMVSPLEYLNRPLEIGYLIDQLEQLAANDAEWGQRLDLDRVGIFGYSFGGTTALSTAGATIDISRVRASCGDRRATLSPAVLLQCRAQYLPPEEYDLGDPRIKAAFSACPLTSQLFGQAGMSTISIPTFVLSGSQDLLTPSVPEQIHGFLGLTTPDKYLGLMVPGTHFSTSDARYSGGYPEILRGNNIPLGQDYLRVLSVAFFKTYLNEDPGYSPYLTASYTQAISQPEMRLNVIRDLSVDRLETAYGDPIPETLTPEPIATSTPDANESILAEIERTGVLKAAIRTDAPPFGYLDANGQWTGYCFDLLDGLRQELTASLDRSVAIELVPLPSNLDNRFQLVNDGTVQLECGPNTIRKDVQGIAFSEPFFYTGTQFLVANQGPADPSEVPLPNWRIGALANTTTQQFLQQQYPQANITYFEGDRGIEAAIEAISGDRIDALANDSILLRGELLQQQLPPQNYTFLPQKPLTCDAYGLILPAGDRAWRRRVSAFLNRENSIKIRDRWLTEFIPDEVSVLNDCLDQGRGF